MPQESRATDLGDALATAFPHLDVEVVPTSVPVAAMGLAVSFAADHRVTYVPALNVWWSVGAEPNDLTETATPMDASINSVVALVAFDLGLYLIGTGRVVGNEEGAEGDQFAGAVTVLFSLAENDDDQDAAGSAALYLTLLNAELDEAQLEAE